MNKVQSVHASHSVSTSFAQSVGSHEKMKRIIKISIWAILLIFNQQIFGQDYRTIEGRIILNLARFDGFYGLPDSTIQCYLALLENIKAQDAEQESRLIREYELIKELGYLYEPNNFIITEEEKIIRIYFSVKDKEEINKTDWFNKIKKQKLHTFLRIRAEEIFEGTFICNELKSIEYKKLPEE